MLTHGLMSGSQTHYSKKARLLDAFISR